MYNASHKYNMNIDAIKKRLANATPGPWRPAKCGSDVNVMSHDGKQYITQAEDDCIIDNNGVEVMGCSEWIRVKWDDLEFMAHARQDIKELIEKIEQLESEKCE